MRTAGPTRSQVRPGARQNVKVGSFGSSHLTEGLQQVNKLRRASGSGRVHGQGVSASPRRSPWHTSLWQGGLLAQEAPRPEAPRRQVAKARSSRSTSPTLKPAARLPPEAKPSRPESGPRTGPEVEALKAGMLQNIRRLQHQIEKPREKRPCHLPRRFSMESREPQADLSRVSRRWISGDVNPQGCQEAVDTAAALILQRQWRRRQRKAGRHKSVKGMEKLSGAIHHAATRIQRVWRLVSWRRAFVAFSEQVGWVGSMEWLQQRKKVFGTELAEKEDEEDWFLEKSVAPPDIEIDPWGNRELKRHLLANGTGRMATFGASGTMKATAHSVVGAHLLDSARYRQQHAMKSGKGYVTSRSTKNLPPAPVVTQQRSKLVSPRCDFREVKTLSSARSAIFAQAPKVMATSPVLTVGRPTSPTSPYARALTPLVSTPRITTVPMLRPGWAWSPTPSRAGVGPIYVNQTAAQWQMLPGTVPCR